MTNNFGTHPSAYTTSMDFQNPYEPNIWKQDDEYDNQAYTSFSTHHAGYTGAGYRFTQWDQDSHITYRFDSPQETTLKFWLRVFITEDQRVSIHGGPNGTDLVGVFNFLASSAAGEWGWYYVSVPIQVGINRIKVSQSLGRYFRIDQVVLQK